MGLLAEALLSPLCMQYRVSNVSPVQDHLQVCGKGGVCQTCWQSVGLLSCTTWAGAQPGLIIGELQSLVSLRMVDRILSNCHVLYSKDKRKKYTCLARVFSCVSISHYCFRLQIARATTLPKKVFILLEHFQIFSG